MRSTVSSGSPFEDAIGFSRAVRVGNIVAVSGTAPIAEDGAVHAPGDVYQQTRRCFEIGASALNDADAGVESIVRTRIFLTDIRRWKDAARAHAEFFSAVRPACTFVEVSGFINPEWLVEIEIDAVVGDDSASRPI